MPKGHSFIQTWLILGSQEVIVFLCTRVGLVVLPFFRCQLLLVLLASGLILIHLHLIIVAALVQVIHQIDELLLGPVRVVSVIQLAQVLQLVLELLQIVQVVESLGVLCQLWRQRLDGRELADFLFELFFLH